MGCVSPKAVVTAVALDWPRISRQFSVERGVSIPDEGCPFSPLGHVWFPHGLVKLPSKFPASGDTQQLLSPRVPWLSPVPSASGICGLFLKPHKPNETGNLIDGSRLPRTNCSVLPYIVFCSFLCSFNLDLTLTCMFETLKNIRQRRRAISGHGLLAQWNLHFRGMVNLVTKEASLFDSRHLIIAFLHKVEIM